MIGNGRLICSAPMHSPEEKVKLVDRKSFESAIGLSSVKQELNPNRIKT